MNAKSPHHIDIIVGTNLRALRQQRNITQTDLGDALSITFQQVQKYEKGTNRISASKLAEIAKFLDVNVATFFEGSGLDGQETVVLPYSKEALKVAEDFDGITDLKVKIKLRQLIKSIAEQSDDSVE